MKSYSRSFLSAIRFLLLAPVTGSPLHAASVTVFAAASLTEALQEIAADYQKQSSDTIAFNFAASGPLVRQIDAGTPADIFFSADEAKMNEAETKDLLVKATRRSLLSNLLVIVAAADSPLKLAVPKDLAAPTVTRIALGDPATVPVGNYAKVWLTQLGLWSAVERKVVPCESVRGVLAAVESGNVEAGIVYKTDAAISKTVKVTYEVAAADGPQIRYPMALLKDSPQPAAARRFMEYLAGRQAGKVFTRKGFILLPPTGKE